jgi:large subunit ribosomal protein L14
MIPADRSGILNTMIFQLYKGSFKKSAFIGDFVKISVKTVQSSHIKLKKTKHKAILVRTKKETLKRDGSWIKFFSNEGVVLKKRTTPLGSEVFGPTIYNLKRRKFLKSFFGIL